MNFVCANEDTNLYTFDLRNLNQVSFFRQFFYFDGGCLFSAG